MLLYRVHKLDDVSKSEKKWVSLLLTAENFCQSPKSVEDCSVYNLED